MWCPVLLQLAPAGFLYVQCKNPNGKDARVDFHQKNKQTKFHWPQRLADSKGIMSFVVNVDF